MSVVSSYVSYINSSQRIRGTPDEFSVQVYPPYVLTNNAHHFRARILSACIPYSFYQVNSANSDFAITFDAITSVLSVPDGNYNVLTLMDAVKNAIVAQALTQGVAITLTTTYNKTNGRVSIGYASSVPAVASLTLIGGATVWRMLGFTTTTVINLGSSATSDRHVDVNPIRSLYIRSDNLSQRFNVENLLEKSVYSDVLCEVPIEQNPGTYINMLSPGPFVRISNKSIDALEFYISSTDDYRLPLDLDWTCSIQIEEVQPDTSFTTDGLVSALVPSDSRMNELKAQRETLLKELEEEKARLKKSLLNSK
jgi:hypothetical protein